jgi:drug/metabolite transporter (DMT)-like permease
MEAPRAPGPLRTVLLMAMLCLIWGTSWLVIKIGLQDIPPFTGAALRFLIAGTCMIGVAHVLSAREGGGRPSLSVVIAHGTFQFALNYGLVYVCQTVIPSGMVAVIWAVFPLFIALGEHFVVGTQRLSGRKWLGIAVSFSGIAALFATDLRDVDARAVPMGLLLLLAPLSVAASTLYFKHKAGGVSSLLLNRDAMWLGAAMLGACAFLLEQPLAVVWTPRAIMSLLYLALMASVLTFGVYFWLLRYVPAYRMSMISFITPLVALLIGTYLGGEPIGPRTVFGALLVLGGVGLTVQRG